MSGNSELLALKQDDVIKMLLAKAHLGSSNLNFQMASYVYKRKTDGTHIINLKKTWEKLLLAARAICAIENPADVYIISSRQTGQRAALKFAKYIGATPIAGRYTPGKSNLRHRGVTERGKCAIWNALTCRVVTCVNCRYVHQPPTGALPRAASADCDGPAFGSPADHGGQLLQHPRDCLRQHRLAVALHRRCDSVQQQGGALDRSNYLDVGS